MQRAIYRLRRHHPVLQSLGPPHITIKSPFLCRYTPAHIVDRLDELCRDLEPLEIRLGRLDHFDRRVIHLQVEPAAPLLNLHRLVVERLAGYVETFNERHEGPGYVPHLTLAERLLPEDFDLAHAALAGFRPPRQFWVDRLHLLKGRGTWAVTRTVPFGRTLTAD